VQDFLDYSLAADADLVNDDDLYDVILVDGMNVLHRAAHSFSDLSVVTREGSMILTGATYGFIHIVKGIWEKYARSNESRITICWDGGYRHRLELYPDYKANRRNKRPEDLEDYQRDLPNHGKALRRILRVAGWCQAEANGYEADDVMATLAKKWGDEDGTRVAIYTMDQDLHQCVTPDIHVISPKWGSSKDTIWTPDAVSEKWGVPPRRVAEVKALAGDSGDNIPGCPGCGKGWARKLLASNRHVTEVLEWAGKGTLEGEYQGKRWKAKALTEKIRENHDLILTCWELAKVVEDAPVTFSHPPPDTSRLRVAFQRLRFHQFLEPNNFQVLTEMA
jgi:5'-3' exonuclease